ncbi:methyltransferase domain-containing protein [Pseudidiomarina halophila]|uniref:Malonyl-ACP O-methyltransferase BioC n=1 Tax=Pseudidiomarina halophila TaxID=1449799 RepID=A0A432Y0E3_9GAMM|nr:methyltransferase domain-containing protein [Pseudidiomarina halophila]RUO54420.1 malonyl-ACP O-methyltransferase BioC [Pseudidiomarina halophila]
MITDPPVTECVTRYDKTRVARQFGRAAESYISYDRLQRQVAAVLIDKLLRQSGALLDIGCGPAHHAGVLQRFTEHYIGVDLATAMLEQAQRQQTAGHWVLADMEQLPFVTASVQTLFSNLAMQWANDLPALLREWLRVLKPGGQLLASTVLPGSMWPLGQCFEELDGERHHNQWPSYAVLKQALTELDSGLTLTEQKFVLSYDTVLQMLRELKGIGANYTVRDSRGLYRRERFEQLAETMESYRTADGKLALHWNIGLISGFKSIE